jgi:very-short-patch-repair endonuclease
VGDEAVHHAGLLLPPASIRPVAALTVGFLRDRLEGRRNGKARAVLQWVDGGADSLLETLARTYFRQAGIGVQTQVYLERVGYVDLLLDGWLVVALDGRHHAEWNQVKRDHRRNNESALQGYTALRYYYSDVVYQPEVMVAQVLAILGRRQ